MTEVSNTEDMIDSRDVIARIEDLSIEDNLDEDEVAELLVLKVLAEEAENCCDWEDGETLISDQYFEQYAEDFANDIGVIAAEHQWPLYCIDWERAARDLQMDYSAVDFDGVTFWVRSS